MRKGESRFSTKIAEETSATRMEHSGKAPSTSTIQNRLFSPKFPCEIRYLIFLQLFTLPNYDKEIWQETAAVAFQKGLHSFWRPNPNAAGFVDLFDQFELVHEEWLAVRRHYEGMSRKCRYSLQLLQKYMDFSVPGHIEEFAEVRKTWEREWNKWATSMTRKLYDLEEKMEGIGAGHYMMDMFRRVMVGDMRLDNALNRKANEKNEQRGRIFKEFLVSGYTSPTFEAHGKPLTLGEEAQILDRVLIQI